MALYMSEKQKDVTVRNWKQLYSQVSGEKTGSRRRVFAEFRKGGVPAWALSIAEQTFNMNGKPPEIPSQMWLSTYDSVADQHVRGWSDEERELIEAKLDSEHDIVKIELPKVEAPYAKYDQHRKLKGQRTVQHAIKDILAVYETAGFDVGRAVAYERQEGNDPAVIAALEALVTVEEPEVELIAG